MSFTPRTIETIYNDMISEKENHPTLSELTPINDTYQDLLSDLDSTSNVSDWRLMIFNNAVQCATLEQLLVEFRTEIETIKSDAIPFSTNWYIDRSLEFQNSSVLVENTETHKLEYANVNIADRQIGYCAIQERPNKLIFKIRGINSDQLTTSDLNMFKSYINKIKAAGTKIEVWNYLPDVLKIYADIIYNQSYPVATIQSNVEAAITDYIKNIEFDSRLIVNKLIDKVQNVEGVIDIHINSLYGKANNTNYVTFQHEYIPTAGYCKIDDSFPLSSTLNYISR